MKKTEELDINYYVELAKREIGKTHDVKYESDYRKKAGEFTVLSFEEENPAFTYNWIQHKEDDTPDGAELGYYRVRINNTKFYNGKEIRVRVKAYVQDYKGLNDHLFISTKDENTGKWLRAYTFPILNW